MECCWNEMCVIAYHQTIRGPSCCIAERSNGPGHTLAQRYLCYPMISICIVYITSQNMYLDWFWYCQNCFGNVVGCAKVRCPSVAWYPLSGLRSGERHRRQMQWQVTHSASLSYQAPAPPRHLTFLRITPVFGAVLENWELWPWTVSIFCLS